MPKRKKAWGLIAARTILGGCLLLFGFNEFHGLLGSPQISAEGAAFIGALRETGYLYYVIKGVEFSVGLLLISGILVPLANLMLLPVLANILLFHLFLDIQGLIVALAMVACSGYIFWTYRDMFKILLEYNYSIDPNSTRKEDVIPKERGRKASHA